MICVAQEKALRMECAHPVFRMGIFLRGAANCLTNFHAPCIIVLIY